MSKACLLRPAALAAALLLALASHADARDLGNYDINAAQRPKAAATAPGAAPADAIGRATFTWVQQTLDASAKAGATDAEGLARAHVRQLLGAHAKQGGDASEVLADARVEVQFGGATLVRFTPRIDGIAVFHEDLALLMDPQQRLVAMRGPLPRERPDDAKSLPAFTLDAEDAVAVALGAHDFGRDVAGKLRAEPRKGDEYRWFRLAAGSKSASGAIAPELQRAKAVWFRTRDGLQPAWYVETEVSDDAAAPSDNYGFVVSARDGRVLLRFNQTAHASAFGYRVWAEAAPGYLPLPSPQGRANTPDPDGLPTHNSVPLVPQELRTLASLPFSRAATDPWLPDGASLTSGNNVNAYADLVAPNGLDAADLQPVATSPGVFDYAFNLALEPNANPTQIQAASVQLFYWINWLHDFYYDRGFAEVDGNAQVDNYGRGGLGGDPIRAEAQDYAVRNNANMSTGADGRAPRMQMGLGNDTPVTDRTINGRTVVHEWTHYLSNRLVGDAAGLITEHSGGLGEGWSDFVALLTLVKEEDRSKPGNDAFQGAYGGGYADHSYYGVRRYPYSTELAKSPLTLRHIAQGVTLPASPAPRFGADGASNNGVHPQGEIWASALWDAYVSLLNDRPRLGFEQAQERMIRYTLGGMKLTPVAPTMTEARDAILATVLANGSSEDYALITAAFAKRGLGAGAQIPDRYSVTMQGTIESTNVGSDIAVSSATLGVPAGCDADQILDVGDSAKLTVGVTNAGFAALPSATATITASDPAITFPAGNTVSFGAVPLFGSRQASLQVSLGGSVAPNTPVTFTITPDAPGIVAPPGIAGSVRTFVNFDEAPRSSSTEQFDGTTSQWQFVRDPVGRGSATWSNRSQGSDKFLHGDDGNLVSVNWAETPPMAVGAEPLTVALRHRFSFEAGASGAPFYDGGVVQASIDGGASWTDVDIGLVSAPLSDCCGNPYATKRAFVAQSAGYPAFVDTTLSLGTAYANQARFKLRFGVATDESVTRDGWDIDRITITGLTDTPFATVVPQAATCATTSYKSLQGAMSGTYYSPARSGEGVLVDFGQVGTTPVVFFSWYTYEGGEQQWLVGSSPFSTSATSVALDLVETSGAGFGSQFRPQDVVSTPWGSAALSFPSCDTLQLTYQKLSGETGTLTLGRGLSRLEPAQCNVLHGGLSGTYYSTQRSGEGVLVDFGKAGNDPVEFFTWYTYEGGRQQWLVGSKRFAPNDATISVDLIETAGAQFGNGFRPQDVVNAPWGKVTQRFVNCDTLELSYEKAGGETGTLTLNRGLQRLGDGVCR